MARKSYQQRFGTNTRAASILFKAFNEQPQFAETDNGDMIRIWGKNDWRHITNVEVSAALRGKVAFDEDELLGWIPPQTIKDAVTRHWLVQGQVRGLYFVTHKAATELDLPRSVGGRKIAFYDAGLA